MSRKTRKTRKTSIIRCSGSVASVDASSWSASVIDSVPPFFVPLF
jgi:hypothetical protein